jgi:hypothetical protein
MMMKTCLMYELSAPPPVVEPLPDVEPESPDVLEPPDPLDDVELVGL